MAKVNWGMYVLLNFFYLPINHNSSQSYHHQVLSLIFWSKNRYVLHNNSILLSPHYIVVQLLKKPSTQPDICPSTGFWDQAHILAMQSEDQLSEAYTKFTAMTWRPAKKNAVEGLNLLLWRYASLPSQKQQCSSRAIIVSGKFIRRAMSMKIVRPPWRNGSVWTVVMHTSLWFFISRTSGSAFYSQRSMKLGQCSKV